MRASVNLAGRRFGKLQVGSETEIRTDSKGRTCRFWMTTCDCGQVKAIRAASLIAGHSKSCSAVRHRRTRFVSLVGSQFGDGKVVVVGYAGVGIDANTGKHYRRWRCKCACNKFFITRATSLLQDKTRSCGCLRIEKARARFRALHLIERQLGKQAIAGIERLAQMERDAIDSAQSTR
jgi:hypothetical protein